MHKYIGYIFWSGRRRAELPRGRALIVFYVPRAPLAPREREREREAGWLGGWEPGSLGGGAR